MESVGEKITGLNFYFIVVILSHWKVEGKMESPPHSLYKGSGGFPAGKGPWCFQADVE